MAIDPTRAAFVQKPFRFKTVENLAVKAAFPTAEEYVIETQSNEADATIYGTNLLAVLDDTTRVFQVTVDAKLSSDDFAGSLPRYTVTFPDHNVSGETMRAVNYFIQFMGKGGMVVRK